MSFVCGTCGQSHEGIPLSFAADYPDQFANMSHDERENRAIIGSDQCIIDSEVFCVRGCLEIPIIGSDEVFLWGLWAHIHEDDFDEISECWEQIDREKFHGPFKGRLMNHLREYPDTLNLMLTINIQPVGQRPLFIIDEADHPLAIAQHFGISIDEARDIASTILHRSLVSNM